MTKFSFSICLFAPLLYVQMVFKIFFDIPFIFLTLLHTLLVSILPPKHQSQMTNPQFLNYMHDVIQVGQICTEWCKNKHTCILLI